MSHEQTFWSQRDAARTYTRLASMCDAVFIAAGALAPRLEPPAAVVAAATFARRLGSLGFQWTELVPESVLLADDRAAASPYPPVEPTVAAVLAAIEALREQLAEVLTRTTPIADGAARRLADASLADVDAALGSLRHSAAPAVR